jgi:ureidoacrylate peracid hydrolase
MKGTWDYDLVEALRPRPGEILIERHSDSGFAGTVLNHHLRSRRIETFMMCGVSSNVGIESTIRAGYHDGYFAVMISDACMAVGPAFMQAATEFNIERFFGWVACTDDVIRALSFRS